MRRTAPLLTVTTIYVLTIVAANYLTSRYGLADVGFGRTVTAGTFAAGAALLVRDFLHRSAAAVFGPRRGVAYVIAAILVAGVVSWFGGSTSRIAIASALAFATAELVDLAVFVPARPTFGFVPAIALSNIVAAPVDTFAFLMIAGFPLTWSTVTGQLLAKLVYATAVPLVLYVLAMSTRDAVAARRATA